MKHLKYAYYILRHKWFVMIECFKAGLYWQGIIHDLSKFLPSEWFPYANYFYKRTVRNKTGYYKPTDTGDKAFDYAWLLHQKRNKHHWQWWILPEDEGGSKLLEIPPKYLVEMICDWIGAGKAQGFKSPKGKPLFETQKWYEQNKHKMQLNKQTRIDIERLLNGYMSLKNYIKYK